VLSDIILHTMPQILRESSRTWGEVYLWYLTEELQYFRKELEHSGLVLDHLRKWNPKRQLEWLSGRYLVHRYMDQDIATLQVDDNGKPSFGEGQSEISISHTDGMVGLMIHDTECGLDLQIATDKIGRVAHKFCHPEDLAVLREHLNESEAQHYIWGLKESIYKAYGKGGLSYMNQMRITSMTPSGKAYQVNATLSLADEKIAYEGKIQRLGKHFMCRLIRPQHTS